MTSTFSATQVDTAIQATVVSALILMGVFASVYLINGAIPREQAPTTYIYDNSTVYVNTTVNTTSDHWVNTTTYVNTSTSQIVYVNTTFVVSIPVVVVSSLTVDNLSIPIPANYSLPVGTVTWVQFNATHEGAGQVNSPWVLIGLSFTEGKVPCSKGNYTGIALIGVPYSPGVYAIVLTISAGRP